MVKTKEKLQQQSQKIKNEKFKNRILSEDLIEDMEYKMQHILNEIHEITQKYDGLELIATLYYARKYQCELSNPKLMDLFIDIVKYNYKKSEKLKVNYDILKRIIYLLEKYNSMWLHLNFNRGLTNQKINDLDYKLLSIELSNKYNTTEPYYVYNYSIERFIKLLEPIKDDVSKVLGFNIKNILTYIDKLYKYYIDLNVSILEEYITEYREDIILSEEINKETIINDIDKKEILKYIFEQYERTKDFKLYDTLVLTPNSISKNEDCKEFKAFLDLFSQDIIEEEHTINNFENARTSESKPIIKYKDKYFVHNITKIKFIAENMIIESIKSEQNLKQTYDNFKGTFLEAESLSVLKKALPNADIFNQVEYDGLDGVTREIDGLIKYDKTIIILEAKARIYNESAKQGRIAHTKSTITRNIEDAIKQLNICKNTIEKSKSTAFRDKKTKENLLEIKSEGLQNILFINLTYDNFYEISSVLQTLKDKNIIKSEDKLPWSICLDDLKVICDFLTKPYEFLHYAYKRSQMNNDRCISDIYKNTYELDFLGKYIMRDVDDEFTKYFTVFEDPSKVIKGNEDTKSIIVDYSSIFNDFYWKKDNGIKINPPEIKYNSEFKNILNTLPTIKDEGYTVISMLLLGLDIETQNTLMQYIKAIYDKTIYDRHLNSFSLANLVDRYNYNREFGITVFTCYSYELKSTRKYFETMCLTRKYEFRSDEWLGILIVVDDYNRPVHEYYYNNKAYEYSKETEYRIKSFKEEVLKTNASKRRYISSNKHKRNDPCFCKSGKKYKLCHGRNK